MTLIPPQLDINDAEGFEGTDIFGYEEFGGRLANLVDSLGSAPVILLDGPWGCGKSTFIKQWAGLLRQKGNKVLYFDAFESDHHDDAFFSLAGKLYSIVPDKEGVGKTLIECSKKIVRTFLPIAGRVATNVFLSGLAPNVDLNAIAELIDKKYSSQEENINRIIEERIKLISDEQEIMGEFRNHIKAIVEKHNQGTSNDKEVVEKNSQDSSDDSAEKKKLVFIIDELDRCKPTFALSLLERVKHLFSVDGVCFVLVANLEQLEKVIAHAYGIKDAQRYLEKFYNLRVTLPNINERVSSSQKYLSYLYRKTPMLNKNQSFNAEFNGIIINFLVAMAYVYDFQLRTLNQIATQIGVVMTVTKDLTFGRISAGTNALIITTLLVMQRKSPEMFSKAKNGTITPEEIHGILKCDDWPDKLAINKDWVKDLFAKEKDEGSDEIYARIKHWCECIDEFKLHSYIEHNSHY